MEPHTYSSHPFSMHMQIRSCPETTDKVIYKYTALKTYIVYVYCVYSSYMHESFSG